VTDASRSRHYVIDEPPTSRHVPYRFLAFALVTLLLAPSLRAQNADADTRAVIAVTDSVLAALSSGDHVWL
jgi:hypothetical protein